jgi:ABC-2 type transport system ATP-binding protein
MAALEVNKLTKTYASGTEALKGIDLTIPEGSFFGLLGPNGAGKSTLIHCIMGLAIPSSGKASVFGNDVVDDYRAARAHVGLAPQDVNLDWFLTVEDTLDYHGGYYGMPKAERRERIDELLEAFSLTEKRHVNSRMLSGGMKRRVVLARALMHRPKMLILDEPTAGVDVELRLELWKYMQKVNKEGTTILLTTHYIEEAEQLCDNLALINNGKIIRTGTGDELKKHYKKKTLEDVYLELVGRTELTRNGDKS